jgi:hypothetical protein
MTERHVKPVRDGWQVEKDHAKRPSAKAATEAEAISRASQIVANEGGGRVIVHSSDGTPPKSRTISADTDDTDDATGSTGTAPAHGRHAAHRNSLLVDLPLIGSVSPPPPRDQVDMGAVQGWAEQR